MDPTPLHEHIFSNCVQLYKKKHQVINSALNSLMQTEDFHMSIFFLFVYFEELKSLPPFENLIVISKLLLVNLVLFEC